MAQITSFDKKIRHTISISSIWRKFSALDVYSKTVITALILILLVAPVLLSTPSLYRSNAAGTTPGTISIDTIANSHPISPYIYGISAGASSYHKDMGVTIDRWGGNQTTRSNWENNDSNSGSDWGLCQYAGTNAGAFSNVSQANGSTVPGLASKNFVDGNKAIGADSLITIPLIGWVAKDGNNNNCSNGVPTHGDTPLIAYPSSGWENSGISGYDPTANRTKTSIPSYSKKSLHSTTPFVYPPDLTDNAVYQDEWVNYLKSTYGPASGGGVKFYSMDNEMGLWSDFTHADIHPARVGYDETLAKFLDYSEAIKSVDPTAQITGPVPDGWTRYFYSSLDTGNDSYATHADYTNHGSVPYLQWFLRNVKAHDTQVGHRTLDVLDVHWYPQSGEYSNDISANMQSIRLQSPRSLYDNTYVDKSWIGGTGLGGCASGISGTCPNVINRLKSWINSEYPGTKLGITEWNWGAEGDINGALAAAMVLGIYGQQDVYLANYWAYPADKSPVYWAFRMFRNYDDAIYQSSNKTQQLSFGDTSVQSLTDPSDVDKISAFASTDSATGDLKIMVINKQPSASYPMTINLNNFSSSGTAKVYEYSSANINTIVKKADITGIGQNVAYNFNPYSITLLVFPKSTGQTTPSSPSATPSVSTNPQPTNTLLNWVNISPSGVSTDFNNPANNYGFISVVVDQQTSAIYMGTNYQGLYKSTNQGTSWTKINTGSGANLIDGGRIWSLAIDPFNHNTLYAASGYGFGGPLKSTDGGVSWINTFDSTNAIEQQIKTNDIYRITVDPYTPNHLLAAFHYFWHDNQDSGVIESFDAGTTWTLHNPAGPWGAGNSIWFLDKSSSWLLGSQGAGIWKTTNSGTSWTQVSTQNITHGGLNALYKSQLKDTYYLAIWNGILKSSDIGQTWQYFNTGLPYAGYQSLVSDGTNLYTQPGCPCGGPYQTNPWYTIPEKGGSTWQAYNTQTTTNGPAMMDFDQTKHIVYGANWLAGVWKLQTSLANPQPTSTLTPSPIPSPTFTIAPSPSPTLILPSATLVPPSPTILPPTPSSTPTCLANLGDLNSDGHIDLTDFSIFASNYGKSTPQLTNKKADLNCDGIVDLTDFSIFASHYGT